MTIQTHSTSKKHFKGPAKMKLFLIVFVVIFFLLFIIPFFLPLTVTNYTVRNSKIPEELSGMRLLILSDFHGKSFGKNEEKLLSKISDCNPDIIIFLGDAIDETHTNENLTLLLQGLSEKQFQKIYAITGNHEFDPAAPLAELYQIYDDYGVKLLDGEKLVLKGSSSAIEIRGFQYQKNRGKIEMVGANENSFSILLYHSPDIFVANSFLNYDLVLSGHSHGGIIRLPFLGGLISNDGSLFPKYDAGVFKDGNSEMIVSRGLGDASIPRYNNPPEIVCVTLEHQ